MPKKIELQQGTAEWLEWRQSHLGGSDAAAAMYLDPYKDRYRLFQEKTGRIGAKAPYWNGVGEETAAERGLRLEPKIRNEYCAENGLFAPPTVLENSRAGEEFMCASLDGLAEGDRIIEIKAPTEAKLFLMAKDGQIPEQHYCQIQHNLRVSELPQCDYIVGFRDEKIIIQVPYDPPFAAELVSNEKLVWSWIQDGIYPVPDPSIEADLNDDEEALRLLAELQDFLRMEDDLAEKKLAIMGKLKRKLYEAGTAVGPGMTMRWQKRRGTVQYMNIPEVRDLLKGRDLDEFRGAESLILVMHRA